jgi:hypothetical protein
MHAQELAQLPGTTSLAERHYLLDCARRQLTGAGELVDLGCWLGSATIPLAAGLGDNPRAGSRAVYAYDRFRWDRTMDTLVQGTPLEGRFQAGDSFLAELEARVAPWRRRIRTRVADLTRATWTAGPIELLRIDAMSSGILAGAISRAFFPALVPGMSLLHYPDFAHYNTSWIHLLMYRLRDYFETAQEVPGSCGLMFRLCRPLPAELPALAGSFGALASADIDQAFDWSGGLVAEARQPALEAARIMAFVHGQRLDEARARLSAYLAGNRPVTQDVACVRDFLEPGQASQASQTMKGWRLRGKAA